MWINTPRSTPLFILPYSELSSAPRIRMRLLRYAYSNMATTGASDPYTFSKLAKLFR